METLSSHESLVGVVYYSAELQKKHVLTKYLICVITASI